MSLTVGATVGPYEVLAPLGAGGMGEVYHARDTRLGRDVALKILPAHLGRDPDALARFEQEARAIAALSHPNILAIHDFAQSGPVAYAVMELLEGETLRARLADGPLSVRKALEIAVQVAAGLAAAHARGIVHRDLKPENVFVTRDGLVKLLDFGLAKLAPALHLRANPPITHATQPGLILGTVGYMAPEQARAQAVDHRTDIFAAGILLYEMVAGQSPFRRASPADTISAILNEDPPALARHGAIAPPALERLIRRCLEKRPEERFESVRDLRFALESLSDFDRPAAAGSSAGLLADVRTLPGRSIAVLPFTNLSADPENEYFSDGLCEELINALAGLPGLRVASRTSAFRFRGHHLDIREIGRQLNVATVLEGSVRRAGRRLRITAQLIDADNGYQLWSQRYDREVAEVFDIQDEITASIVRTLAPTLRNLQESLARRHTTNVEAFELYLKGRQLWHQRTPVSLRAGVECFRRAIALDPAYALAHAGLADSFAVLGLYGYLAPAEGRPQAEAAVNRALALDPTLPDAHFATALFTAVYAADWAAAEPHFVKALEIHERSPVVQAYYSLFLAARHRFDEAAVWAERAAQIDPLSPFSHAIAALAMHAARRLPDAARLAARALELHPDFPLGLWTCGLTACRAGEHDRARAVLERLVEVSHRGVIFVGVLGFAHGLAGRRTEALAVIDELRERRAREFVPPFAFALVETGLGNLDAVGGLIDAALDDGFNGFGFESVLGPFIDDLREDERFVGRFARLGLPGHVPRPPA